MRASLGLPVAAPPRLKTPMAPLEGVDDASEELLLTPLNLCTCAVAPLRLTPQKYKELAVSVSVAAAEFARNRLPLLKVKSSLDTAADGAAIAVFAMEPVKFRTSDSV